MTGKKNYTPHHQMHKNLNPHPRACKNKFNLAQAHILYTQIPVFQENSLFITFIRIVCQ